MPPNPNNVVAAHPPEPAELVQMRDKLLVELEKQAKTATGTLQQVLRKMIELLNHTKPGSPMNFALYEEVKEAFVRFSKDPGTTPPPMVLMECVEFLQSRLNAFGFTPSQQPAEAAPAAAPAPRPAGVAATKDGFESSGPQRSLSINPEADVRPTADPKSEQQQLESFKAWMKNPSIGKVKG